MTRASSAMPGAPLPPSRQPNVSRMSLHVATRVMAGRSANPLPHTCSASAHAGSLTMAIPPRPLCKVRHDVGDEQLQGSPRGRVRQPEGGAIAELIDSGRLVLPQRHHHLVRRTEYHAVTDRRSMIVAANSDLPHVSRLGKSIPDRADIAEQA